MIGIVGLVAWAIEDIFTYEKIGAMFFLLYRVVPCLLLGAGLAIGHLPGVHMAIAIVLTVMLLGVVAKESVELD